MCCTTVGIEGVWPPLKIPVPKALIAQNEFYKGKSIAKNGLRESASEIQTTFETDLDPYDYIYGKYEYGRTDVAELYKLRRKKEVTVTEDSRQNLTNNPISPSEKKVDETHNEVDDENSYLRGIDRLKLIHSIIYSNQNTCCHLDVYRLIKEKCILAYFPLHDYVELRELEQKWLKFWELPWKVSI